jgi:hypothetical protein
MTLRPEGSAYCHPIEDGAGVAGPVESIPAGYEMTSSPLLLVLLHYVLMYCS